MSGRSKTTSTAVAALVVAAAATVTSLWSFPEAGTPATPGASASATASPAASPDVRSVRARAAGASVSASSSASASGLPATDPGANPGRSVLFVGRSAALNPRGGVTKSFACRAAASLAWSCLVREGASPVVPASVTAGVVVVALVPSDDAARVGRLLDRLPPSAGGVRTLLLGPIAVTSDTAATQRLKEVRRLAKERGAVVVDPVAEGWVTSRTAATYLAPGGSQLTAAGHAHAAARLAAVLRSSSGR